MTGRIEQSYSNSPRGIEVQITVTHGFRSLTADELARFEHLARAAETYLNPEPKRRPSISWMDSQRDTTQADDIGDGWRLTGMNEGRHIDLTLTDKEMDLVTAWTGVDLTRIASIPSPEHIDLYEALDRLQETK